MVRLDELKKQIKNSGLKLTFIAAQMGITRETLYNKLEGESEFKASEINMLTRLLKLSKPDRDYIFFDV